MAIDAKDLTKKLRFSRLNSLVIADPFRIRNCYTGAQRRCNSRLVEIISKYNNSFFTFEDIFFDIKGLADSQIAHQIIDLFIAEGFLLEIGSEPDNVERALVEKFKWRSVTRSQILERRHVKFCNRYEEAVQFSDLCKKRGARFSFIIIAG